MGVPLPNEPALGAWLGVGDAASAAGRGLAGPARLEPGIGDGHADGSSKREDEGRLHEGGGEGHVISWELPRGGPALLCLAVSHRRALQHSYDDV